MAISKQQNSCVMNMSERAGKLAAGKTGFGDLSQGRVLGWGEGRAFQWQNRATVVACTSVFQILPCDYSSCDALAAWCLQLSDL